MLGVRAYLELELVRPLDLGVGSLEVETLLELLARLVERVVDLLPIDLGNDVKRCIFGHIASVFYEAVCRATGARGRIPKWPKGPDCKSGGSAFRGSNPLPPTRRVIGRLRSNTPSHCDEWIVPAEVPPHILRAPHRLSSNFLVNP